MVRKRGPYLTVIKRSMYGQVVYIWIQDRSHLRLLNRADLAFGMEDEDADILLPPQAIDSRRSRISTGGTNHSEVMPPSFRAVPISSQQKVFKKISKKLQSNIFERECGAMEELQKMKVQALVEGNEGRNGWHSESRIASLYDVLKVRRRDLRW